LSVGAEEDVTRPRIYLVLAEAGVAFLSSMLYLPSFLSSKVHDAVLRPSVSLLLTRPPNLHCPASCNRAHGLQLARQRCKIQKGAGIRRHDFSKSSREGSKTAK